MFMHKGFPALTGSTRDFVREARTIPRYSFFDLVHGYCYSRWPYFYIGVATGEHPLARLLLPLFNVLLRKSEHRRPSGGTSGDALADGYHGKVVPLAEAEKLVSVNREVQLRAPEQVVPYPRARDIILKNPDHIAVLQCPCRSSRSHPCTPLDVCLVVGEPFATFVAEHHPRRARRIGREEALQILRSENERGHVHHAFFKDAMLDRFYAICSCCSCCCGAMQAHRSGTPMLASSGYVSRVDTAVCAGCGDCSHTCHFGALEVKGGKNRVDTARCMGCAVCVGKCARGALSMVREPGRGVPLDISALTEAAGA